MTLLRSVLRIALAVVAISVLLLLALGWVLSDHRNYWAEGFPAFMVTDTAFLRNPNYHMASDTADTLDYSAMAGAVDGVLGTVVHLANE